VAGPVGQFAIDNQDHCLDRHLTTSRPGQSGPVLLRERLGLGRRNLLRIGAAELDAGGQQEECCHGSASKGRRESFAGQQQHSRGEDVREVVDDVVESPTVKARNGAGDRATSGSPVLDPSNTSLIPSTTTSRAGSPALLAQGGLLGGN
jgi:hypothetical protein